MRLQSGLQSPAPETTGRCLKCRVSWGTTDFEERLLDLCLKLREKDPEGDTEWVQDQEVCCRNISVIRMTSKVLGSFVLFGRPPFSFSACGCAGSRSWEGGTGEERHGAEGSLSHSGTRGARNATSSGRPGPLRSFIDGHLWRPVVARITRKKVTEREEKMGGRTRGLILQPP